MAVPQGINKHDHYEFGRPTKYNLKELAEHLNNWSKDSHNHDMLAWLDEADVDPRLPSQWAKIDQDFSEAWFKAKSRIARRRNEMAALGELPNFMWARVNHNYDVLHYVEDEAHRDKDAKRQAKAKIEAEKELSIPASNEKLDSVLNMLTKLQSEALNKAEIKINKAE